MVGGALITFGLPAILGAAGYGQYTDLNNTMSIFSMMLITGALQGVSRFTSEGQGARAIAGQALRVMLIFGGLVALAFVIGAPWIAEARSNPDLANGYRFAGAVLFSYSLYAVFIGVLNGRKRFAAQAGYDIAFTTLKAALVLGLAVAGLGVVGAFGGFAIAAALILMLAAWRVWPTLGAGEKARGLLPFVLQIMLYTLVFNLSFKLDVLVFKPLALDLMSTLNAGAGPEVIGEATDTLVGQYGLAVSLSRLPWQATIAITFVIFPMLSEATLAGDRARAQAYIRETLRYAMLLVGAAAAVLVALPESLIALWPADLAPAARVLAWTAPAYFLFSLFNLINTLLTSAGRAGSVLVVGLITAGLTVGLFQVLLNGATQPDDLLTGSGMATLLTFVGGTAISVGVLWRLFGPPLKLGTTLRVLGVGGGLAVLGRLMDHGLAELAREQGGLIRVALIGGTAAAVGLLYLVGLWITREFGEADKARLRRVLRRRK